MSRFIIALVFVAGCAPGVPSIPGLKGVAPTGAQEQAVAKHVLETANDPKSVEFVKWGPHLTVDLVVSSGRNQGKKLTPAEELQAREQLDKKNFGGVFRVVYRSKNNSGAVQMFDTLIGVNKDHTINTTESPKGMQANDGGEDWIKHAFPGIK